ncbi:DUF1090 family protein [Streptomyces sp. NPDC056670]|uniref:DUF1090 family protein n=1 Tax=Streptomyces sp. NPDC056670 TaxID=3345904 RepID=UPI0036AFA802
MPIADSEAIRNELEQEVLERRNEVAEREKDLKMAEKKGDAERINTRKDKLAEARAALQKALAALNA